VLRRPRASAHTGNKQRRGRGGHDEGLTARGEERETTGIEEMAAPAELGGGGSGSKRLRGSGGPPVTERRATSAARQGEAQGSGGSLRGRF
jgi:hypothetical protein